MKSDANEPTPRHLAAVPAADSELLTLVARLCDGLATREDCLRLDALLTQPEAIEVYCAAMEVHTALEWLWGAGARTGAGPMAEASRPPSRPAASRRQVSQPDHEVVPRDRERRSAAAFLAAAWSAVWWAITALPVWRLLAGTIAPVGSWLCRPAVALGLPLGSVAIIMASVAITEFAFPMRPVAGQRVVWPSGAIAVFSGLRGAEPVPGSRRLRVAEILPVGSVIELAGGLAEITYRCGATIVVEGPASFVVCGENSLALNRGKLSARVEAEGHRRGPWDWIGVSAAAQPLFSVHTPKGVVHDRGTEFGVLVADDGATAVRVFSGIVDFLASGRSGGRAVRLSAGESAGLAAAGRIVRENSVPPQLDRPLPRLGSGEIVAVPRAPDTFASHLRYYQPCDDLLPHYEAERVHPNPQLEPGKIGRAFRIEERWAVNLVKDADLEGGQDSGWGAVGEPRWLEAGGRFSPSCAAVDAQNHLRQVVAKIQPDTLCCVSVYARAAPGAEGSVLVLAVQCGEKAVDVESPPLAADYVRVVLPFVAKADAAILTVRSKGEGRAIVDGVQLEAKNRSFPRSFNPKQGEPLETEWVDIPPRSDIFDANRGTIAFWTRPDWIGQSNSGSAFFGSFLDRELPDEQQRSCMTIVAYSDPNHVAPENRGDGIHVAFRDRSGRAASYVVPLDERFRPGAWVHVVVTWRIDPAGESSSVFYVDGRRAAEKRFTIDRIDPPTMVWMGYSRGGYVDGLIDEFCIFDRPLGDGEAAELAARTEPLTPGPAPPP